MENAKAAEERGSVTRSGVRSSGRIRIIENADY